MSSIIYMGGLGNQVFQYIASQIYEHLHHTPVKHSSIYYQGVQTILGNTPRTFHLPVKCRNIRSSVELLQNKLKMNRSLKIIRTYNSLIASGQSSNIILKGYFQEHEAFKDKYLPLWANFYESMKRSSNSLKLSPPPLYQPESSLYVHVRKGDYLNHKNIYHPLDRDYFICAIKSIIESGHPIENIIFFTDSPLWVVSQLITELTSRINIRRYNIRISDLSEVNAFLELCNADYLIISNSSFSLSAAHISLINNRKRVLIQPDYWATNKKNHLWIK